MLRAALTLSPLPVTPLPPCAAATIQPSSRLLHYRRRYRLTVTPPSPSATPPLFVTVVAPRLRRAAYAAAIAPLRCMPAISSLRHILPPLADLRLFDAHCSVFIDATIRHSGVLFGRRAIAARHVTLPMLRHEAFVRL